MFESGQVLSEMTGDYWVHSRIKTLHKPSNIEFLREAVCSYEPVIISGARMQSIHAIDSQEIIIIVCRFA